MTTHVLPDERALLLESTDPTVLQRVPSAFQLTDGLLGMPHDLNTVVGLAAMGLNPPSPIEHYYHWPRDRVRFPDVFPHQKVTAGFLTKYPRAYCLNGIGTMKTITSLWAADYLLSENVVDFVLIVAPIESLERTWGDTLFFHMGHRKATVLSGAAERRKKRLATPCHFYVVNPDGLVVLQKELVARSSPRMLVIIDELADFRHKTRAWKALNEIIYPDKRPPVTWVWGLTGTPRPQEASDPYYQCKLVTPTTVPKFFTQFKNMTMEPQSLYVFTERKEAQAVIYQAMRPAIRYTRDVLDLPGDLHTTLDVKLSDEQTKHYKEIARELFTEIQGGRKVTAVNEGVKRSKLLQIACGVVYDVHGEPVEIDAGNRIETLLSTIERIDEKVIVFVPFTEVTNTLVKQVRKHWSAEVVYGDISKTERDRIFGDFQDKPDPSVLIAHPQCMSRSLTLTEASTIIWYAPIDSNYIYEQANGRISRQGQRYVANYIHLAGSAIERAMYRRLALRQSMQGALLELVEKGDALI